MNKITALLFCLPLLLASCTEKIEVDQPAGVEKLVVDGAISTETDSSYVKLTKSISYFSGAQIPAITDATVSVNGIAFTHAGNGRYAPPAPFTGQINTRYNLKVTWKGQDYTSSAMLDPLFHIDTVFSTYKEKEPPIKAGYTVTMLYTDNRTPVKYTYFRFGYSNGETQYRDSIYDNVVLFDNKDSKLNEQVVFEIPFLRLKDNDTAVLMFRSADQDSYNFYAAASEQGGGGPFSTPPANLPTNIRGGALGLFTAYQVQRFRLRVH